MVYGPGQYHCRDGLDYVSSLLKYAAFWRFGTGIGSAEQINQCAGCRAGSGNEMANYNTNEFRSGLRIMIDGDPLSDLTLFQDEANILMIMKDGAYHKRPRARRQAARQAAAE